MFARSLSSLTLLARRGLFVLTTVTVAAAFVWVATRPLRMSPRAGIEVELTLLHQGGKDEDAIVAGLVQSFEAAYPHIHVRRINAGTAIYRKLQTMMAAGDPPDVFFLEAAEIPRYADLGLLAPLDERLATPTDQPRALRAANFFKPVLDSFRFDGQVAGRGPLYGLPWSFTTVGFYYNRDLFERAGLPEPPNEWTWDDFIAAARAIGQLELDDGEPCYGASFVTWENMIRTYLWTVGGELFAPDLSAFHADQPANVAALERLRRWRFEEGRALTGAKSQVELGADLFVAGRVGMYGPLGRWMVPNYRRQTDLDWDFAPLPHGEAKANVVFAAAWSIAAATSHPDEAWTLAQYMCGPQGQEQLAAAGLAIPSLRRVAHSPAFINPDVPPSRDELYLDMVADARLPRWPTDARYPDVLKAQMEGCLQVGTVPVADALATVQRQWEQIAAAPQQRDDAPPMPWGTIMCVLLAVGLAGGGLLGWRWWRKRPSRLAFREELTGMAFISPWAIGFVCITAFPIGLSLLLAFCRWQGIVTLDHARFVGLGNFTELLTRDDLFHKSLRVTAYYAGLAVPTSQLAALGAAMLMAAPLRGVGIFRSAWYLPSVLAGVGMAVLWKWVFDADHGLLNRALNVILTPLGFDAPAWLGADADWFGPPAFAIMHLWMIGGSMMIYLAGLHGIPQTLYEAAEIDGAGPLRRLRNVTLPMLSPVIFFNVIMAVIASFQVFTQAYVMTAGGPNNATRFYVLYLYDQAFGYHEMGYASAMAWLLLILILGLTLAMMRGSRRYVYYEGLRA